MQPTRCDKASGLAGRLHPVLRASIGDLVRSMNRHYSNLIEGHNDYAGDAKRRNLQLEARAHIEVQRLIGRGGAPTPVMSVQFITWTHWEFCERLPDDLLWVENPDTKSRIRVVPCELRKDYAAVGSAGSACFLPATADRGLCLATFLPLA